MPRFGSLPWLAGIVLLSAHSAALAQFASPLAYSMPNGDTGAFNYWDAAYNGTGSLMTDNAPLSGGTGYLTDGILGSPLWDSTIVPNGHNGQDVNWVGWIDSTTPNPAITFDFGAQQQFTTTSFYFSNGGTNGVGDGGVSLPASLTLAFSEDGVTFGNSITQTVAPDNSDPSARFVDVASPVTARYMMVTLGYANRWIFLSEARFGVQSVVTPEPGSLALLATSALTGAGFLARRRKNARQAA